MANSIAAYAQLHGDVPNTQSANRGIIDQGKYGDTQYYMIAADAFRSLPLVTAGVPGAVLAVPDAILRVWIEDAYVRGDKPGRARNVPNCADRQPGQPDRRISPRHPGWHRRQVQEAGIGQALGNPRPLGTADVYRPFGVGGQAYTRWTEKHRLMIHPRRRMVRLQYRAAAIRTNHSGIAGR